MPSNKTNKPSPTDLAKFSVPRSSTWVKRQRLFDRLDQALTHPITWICAPAGSGKTTLLASYLQGHETPVLWYNLDANDADPASFFYHLRHLALALAPRRKLRLPPLTPDYLPAIQTYATNFFREFFRVFSRGGIVVLDNVQDVDPQSGMLRWIGIAQQEVPEGVAIVCLSREAPSALFSRAQLNGLMVVIDRSDLRWNHNEIIAMAESMSVPVPSADGLEWLQTQTDGWAAGLTLLLQETPAGFVVPPLNSVTEQTLFNYFNLEIFQRFTADEQQFLLTSAFLPEITEKLAVALTGETRATQLLEKLVSKNYFTVQLCAAPPTYRYHPLFRNFLLHQAQQRLPSIELTGLRTAAAKLLAGQHNYTAAVPLFIAAHQWLLLADLLCKIAPSYIAEGRHQTLLDWLNDVPDAGTAENAWLLYWKAAASMPTDFNNSHALFAESYQHFRQSGEGSGMVLAWAGAVETVVHSLSHTERLDYWIDQLSLLRQYADIDTDPVQQSYIAPQVVAVYALRGNQHTSLEKWLTVAQDLLTQPIDPTQRIMASFSLITYFHWSGQPARTESLLQQQQAILNDGEASPLATIITKLCSAWFGWIYGRHDQCSKAIEEGLDIVERTGVQHWTFILLIQGITNTLMQGRIPEAKKYFERLEPLQHYARDMDRAYFHNESGWLAILNGHPEQALRHELTAVAFAESMGAPFVMAETYFGLSQAYHATGNEALAWDYLNKARKKAACYGSQTLSFQCGLVEAYYQLSAHNDAAAEKILTDVLASARLKGYSSFAWWRRDVIACLCHFALANSIEPELTRNLIRQFQVMPPESGPYHVNWPWPVRIYTLGHFAVLVDDEQLTFDRKAQKRPLELLKLLITLGGSNIAEGRVIDALWPDTDADMARQNLKSTLHRLRKLIPAQAVSVTDGKITLQPQFCWVDLTSLENIASEIVTIDDSASIGELVSLCTKLKTVYRGNFLENDNDAQWSIVARERYHSLFLRSIEKLGEALLRNHSYEAAIECYEHGLSIDPLVERFYQGLMHSYRGMKLAAEVLAVLERCRNVLHSSLDLNCSPETEHLAHLPIA